MTRHKNSPSRKPRFPRKYLWVGGVIMIAIYIFCFYYFFVSPTGFRWRALYGDSKYPEGYEIQGIDISHYQGRIDWKKLRGGSIKGCPVRFVMIKATEGSTKIDDRFADNFYQARENGFIRGAYHFWSVKSTATAQARFFIKNVKLESGDLPPVLDIEKKPTEQSIEEFQLDVLTWLHMVEDQYHVRPILYTYLKFKQLYLSSPVFESYPFWMAHYYVDKVEYEGEWRFWQHTDAGRLPGIKGEVDFDIYNGSYYDLQKFCIQ